MIDSSEVKVKSLQKALEILNCFAEKQPLGVTETVSYTHLGGAVKNQRKGLKDV